MIRLALFCLALSWALSAATVLSYLVHAPRLRLLAGDTPMAFNTSICLLCLATAGLVLLHLVERGRRNAG